MPAAAAASPLGFARRIGQGNLRPLAGTTQKTGAAGLPLQAARATQNGLLLPLLPTDPATRPALRLLTDFGRGEESALFAKGGWALPRNRWQRAAHADARRLPRSGAATALQMADRISRWIAAAFDAANGRANGHAEAYAGAQLAGRWASWLRHQMARTPPIGIWLLPPTPKGTRCWPLYFIGPRRKGGDLAVAAAEGPPRGGGAAHGGTSPSGGQRAQASVWGPSVAAAEGPPQGGGAAHGGTSPSGEQRAQASVWELSFHTPRLIGVCAAWTPPDGPDDPDDPDAPIVVPPGSGYLVRNQVMLFRVSDGFELPAISLDLAADADSFTYQWRASLPAALAEAVMPAPDPVEVEAVINGCHFRLLVEDLAFQEHFGQARISVGSRGKSARLAAPAIPPLSLSNPDGFYTAQQLALAAIDNPTVIDSGAGAWAIEWGLEQDWLVPEGAWAFQGTPVEAVAAIANAGGGILQPHPVDNLLRVLPRYPVLPWAWGNAVPDVTLPRSVAVAEAMEWKKTPAWERVYVMGADGNGVIGQVTRAGTAGITTAPAFTHMLITDAYAARMKGAAILADSGPIRMLTWTLPVMPDLGGILLPGTLVELDGIFGIVRAVSVACAFPVVRQTITVETRY